jgi:general stress protein 26
MKTETQNNPELAKVCKLIENMSVAMMTNMDGEGALVSRPMAPLEMDANGAIWFFTDMRSSKVEHLVAVNLGFSDPDKSTYVSLSGRGELHADKDRIARLWTAFARPWFPDGPDSEHLALLKFVPSAAEYWDAPDSKMVRLFAMAASVAAGKPIAMGEHERLTALSARSASGTPA